MVSDWARLILQHVFPSLFSVQVLCSAAHFIYYYFFLFAFSSVVIMEFPPRTGWEIENPRTASGWVGPLLLGGTPDPSSPLPIEGLTLGHCQLPVEVPPGSMRLHALTLEYSWRCVRSEDVRANTG